MFERFTERARRVVVLAQDAAHELHQARVGTEHILLGLIREEEGMAAMVLAEFNVGTEAVLGALGNGEGAEAAAPERTIDFGEGARDVYEGAERESARLADRVVGTEHILLSLCQREAEEPNAALASLALDWEEIRRRVLAS